MGLFNFLFGKRQRHDPRVGSIVSQAMNAVQQHVSTDEQREMAQGVEQTLQELIKANQTAPSGLTQLRLEMNMVVVAQSIGLMVWELFGQRLPEKNCVQLAQGLAILELYNQQSKIPAGNQTHEWYDKAIAQQVLARQASTPVVLCFMGQEDQARQMVVATLEAAKLPTDEEIVQAMQQIGAG